VNEKQILLVLDGRMLKSPVNQKTLRLMLKKPKEKPKKFIVNSANSLKISNLSNLK
jgi:hypothetical protein